MLTCSTFALGFVGAAFDNGPCVLAAFIVGLCAAVFCGYVWIRAPAGSPQSLGSVVPLCLTLLLASCPCYMFLLPACQTVTRASAHSDLRDRLKKIGAGLKVLGTGELDRKLTIRAHKFSQSALDKIQKAGGTAEVI